ncbi:ABC transporter permease [Actinoplanes philippinensis]|uniref:Iron complex transport system permease protein n=1 Tax=Actinoplanes philippinensis TaxID=35752 RepID=A0A1I2N4A6_9ACTN|nr:iron chelate uptake ABC transporter family permease subunit [Actinoplanes philippinensis]GIE83327.1 ABC transporter permease [Actinoplanes philippinensis]SFF97679.1 iron complex transport system permease protein [Actinoplanes philippinensis]
MSTSTLEAVTRGRRRRRLRRRTVLAVAGVAVAVMAALSLMIGQTFYPPGDVLRVILGETVPGASFTVGELRLPRTVLALITGLCFGMGGVTFQTMMRNPLASPDIIGISSAASAAAAFAIIVLGLGETGVSVFAIVAALGVAVVIYVLSFKDGVAGARLVLIGIGIAAMLNSVTSYVLNQAGQWDLQAATRWLNGSLNGSTWDEVAPVLVALAVFGPVLLAQARNLTMLQLGDDTAAALGTRLERTRLISIVAAVGLIAFATSATGPIAFVAFLAGPIAARLVGPGGSLLVPSALAGALLVLVADFLGQFAFDTRFPVGVITGVLGAPYLIFLLVRTNRAGGAL